MRTILFCLAILLAQAVSATVLYNVVDLGPGIACGISDNGYIMGADASGQLWRTKDGVKQSFAAFLFEGKVNSSGQMVGTWSEGSVFNYFYYDGAKVTKWTGGEAYNINNSGVAVGCDSQGQCYTILNGVRTALPTAYYYTYAINDSGTIAGLTPSGDGISLHSSDGKETIARYTNAVAYGCPTAMADNGHVTGYEYAYGTGMQWFIYDGQQFNWLPAGTRLSPNAVPLAINEFDVVVGVDGPNHCGYVYREGALVDLNNVISPSDGWHITEADDVNNNGQIVGSATINGEQHAVLLNPIPEPTTMAILGLSAVAILRKRQSL